MAKAAEIQLEGMRELRKALKDLSADPVYKAALKGAYGRAAQLVAERAQAKARSRSNPRMGSKATGAIKGKATTTHARIDAYKGVPWGPGHEFGSNKYRQFPSVNKGGYNIYPTISEDGDEIGELFAAGIEELLSAQFPE